MSKDLIIGVLIFIIAILVCIIAYIKRECYKINKSLEEGIDLLINGKKIDNSKIYFETTTSKVLYKFKKLSELIESKEEKYSEEKNSIKALIGDISHQIKTPLSNLIMYNETLINRELDEEKRKLFLNNMKYQLDKLNWLLENLLKMSRLEGGVITLKIEKNNALELIKSSLDGVSLKAKNKNIEIILDVEKEVDLVCDFKWTREALFNILENAIKYSREDSKVNIKVTPLDIFTKIEIIDEGIGIRKEEMNDIFKRFYRGQEVHKEEGVGVGLFLAREIISMDGGYITVDSIYGEGSIFSIYLLTSKKNKI